MNLDALRGIAALLVVVFHFDKYSELLARHVDSEFFRRAYLMVDVFFVLSGFVMSHVYGGWFDDGVTRGEARRFLVARLARIYPLHVLTLLYLVGIVIARYRFDPSAWQPQHAVAYSPAVLPMHILLLNGMNTTRFEAWNYPSWSISTEWWIYLMFPLLVRPVRCAGPRTVALIALACFATYVGIMLYLVPLVTVPAAMAQGVDAERHTIDVTYQYGFIRCAAGFVLGMLAHRAYEAGRWRGWLAGGQALIVLTAGAAVAMHRGLPDPVTVAFFPLLVLSAAYGGRTVDAVLGSRALRRLGQWSYAVYLIHIPLIQTLFLLLLIGAMPEPESDRELVLLFVGYLVVTIASAGLVHRFVERPLRDNVKRWLMPADPTPC